MCVHTKQTFTHAYNIKNKIHNLWLLECVFWERREKQNLMKQTEVVQNVKHIKVKSNIKIKQKKQKKTLSLMQKSDC